ncbi:MAG: FAD:protein FMN transferase [Thermomicrobiales bacterium]
MSLETTSRVHQHHFAAMGCRMLAALDAPVGDGLADVPSWFAAWEIALSRFRPDIRVGSTRPARRSGSVSSLWLAIQAALWAARLSDGLVVPTILPALEAAGYDRPFAALAAPPSGNMGAAPAQPEVVADWRAIRCDPRTRTVLLPPGVRIDLGGVAKGWAADRAARCLGERGPALLDAGGDIAASAPPRGAAGWAIGVAEPGESGASWRCSASGAARWRRLAAITGAGGARVAGSTT